MKIAIKATAIDDDGNTQEITILCRPTCLSGHGRDISGSLDDFDMMTFEFTEAGEFHAFSKPKSTR